MALPLTPEKILLIQIRRLGDVVLTTALASDLRQAFPKARIDFLVGRPAAALLLHNPAISNVLIFDPKKLFRMIRTVRAVGYDLLIDVQVHPRTALLTRFSGVPVRAGWDARFWGRVYNRRTPRDTVPMYVVQNRRRLLAAAGIPHGNSLPRLFLSQEEREQAAIDAQSLGLENGKRTVALALGTHDPARDWKLDGFARVAEQLMHAGLNVLIFRFPGDDVIVSEFRALTHAGTLAEWKGDRRFLPLLARCAALVSANTGPSHMALALGVPRVTIYGSTNPDLWDPHLPNTVAINNPRQPCHGCGQAACPVDRACIQGIQPEEVFSAVQQLLSRC